MRISRIWALCALVSLASCTKTTVNDDDNTAPTNNECAILNTIHVTATTPATIGQTVTLSIPEVNGYRIYSWYGPNNFNSQYPSNTINYVELKNEGWYYVTVSKPTCSNTKYDSVYLDVKLTQGTPPCTITANTSTYSNLFNDTYTNVRKMNDPSYNFFSLNASGTTTVGVCFHPHWSASVEPEDGVYTTVNTPSFDPGNYDKVFISTVKQSIWWSSHPDQKVYVSHTSTGKLQVRYCNLILSGSNGTSYTTSASANLIQQ